MRTRIPNHLYAFMFAITCIPVSFGVVFDNYAVIVIASFLGVASGFIGMRITNSMIVKVAYGVPTGLNAIIVIYIVFSLVLYLWDTSLNKPL